jgi:hypothetical protein
MPVIFHTGGHSGIGTGQRGGGDRLLAGAHRLELRGDSLRKTRQTLTDREHLQ